MQKPRQIAISFIWNLGSLYRYGSEAIDFDFAESHCSSAILEVERGPLIIFSRRCVSAAGKAARNCLHLLSSDVCNLKSLLQSIQCDICI